MAEGIKLVLRRNMSAAMGAGDLSQAALILERLKEEDPLSVETRGMELEYLLRTGRLREARVVADQLLQTFPASPRIHYLAGQVAYRLKDYKEAAERFRESNRIRHHWRSSMLLAKSLTQLALFDEAASIYESLLPDHPECYTDLGWLYERREDYGRALAAIETCLKHDPDNQWAQAQRLRLRARVMDPAELVRETDQLLEFGEELAEAIVPQYVEALFRTGRPAELRNFISQRRATLRPQLAAATAWVCYRYQAYDLAFDLFTTAFPANVTNVKFLSAMEFAATRSGRIAEIIRLYTAHASEDRRLFGRAQKLSRRSSSNPSDS